MGIQSSTDQKPNIKMCRRDWHVYILALALLHYVLVAAADFHEDEFVPTSRRAQFSGVSCCRWCPVSQDLALCQAIIVRSCECRYGRTGTMCLDGIARGSAWITW